MPPRHAYWTILVDDQPTAFRAHDPEELLPTLNRLREKNQTAVMKWFERGQLFESRDAARDAGLGRGERRWEGPRPDRSQPAFHRDGRDDRDSPRERRTREQMDRRTDDDQSRDRNWRPGGEHRDPRQKYRDAKKAKWNRFKQKIREGHERRTRDDNDARPQNTRSTSPKPKYSPPHGDPLRRGAQQRPRFDRPYEDRQGKPTRPHGDRFRSRPQYDDRRGPSDTTRPKWGSKPGGARRKPSFHAAQDRPFKSTQRKPFHSARGKSVGSPRGKPFGSNQGKWGPKREDDRRRRRRDEDE